MSPPHEPPASLHLLLVEDDGDIALLIRKALERAGHQVAHASSGTEALTALAQHRFDLALLDHHLPDMAGLQLLESLLREGVATPALMVTAYGDEQLATRVLHAGALDYVVKDPDLQFLHDLPKRVSESVRQHRLQQLNRLLLSAVESAGDGIFITDLHGTILHVNQALERMTGYTRRELLGQNPRLFKSDVHPPELFAGMWRAILARSSWHGELTNRRKDGSLAEVSLTVSPIVNGRDQLTHFVGIQRDVTERKLLQRQLIQAQKMQGIGTLAGGIAHEFNNLLTGIVGYASLGRIEPSIEALREYLEHIVSLSERAATLTRQLLSFARTPALSRRPTPMNDLVRATAELISRSLSVQVQLDLQEQSADGSLLVVEADASQLQQALVNLALNAREALRGNGAVTFRLRQRTLTAEEPAFPEAVMPGDYVVLEVADTGCGMSPEVLNQALDPFYTTKDVGRGTGLGLPVVLGIVHAHLGYLTIDSAPGQGTRVDLYLPRLPRI